MSRIPSRSARAFARGTTVVTPAHAGFRPAAAALAVAAVFAGQPGTAAAQVAPPAGNPQVIHGQASFVQTGNNLVITTQNGLGTSHSAINWQSFSVPAGSLTQFIQPSATSTSINRVTGSDPSSIFGTLSSNGRLVLVNPAGITVGAGAVVDTAGFTASTLQMSDADALAGRLRFSNAGSSASLTVNGTIRAQGGDIVLIAPDVQTTGEALIQSDGATVLAAGHTVEITGRGLEGIHLDVQAGDQAVNLGTLQGDAVGIFAGTLRHSGVIQANAVSVQGGKVVLQALAGDGVVDGSVEAHGNDASVNVTASGSITGAGSYVTDGSIDAAGTHGAIRLEAGGSLAFGSVDTSGATAATPHAGSITLQAGGDVTGDRLVANGAFFAGPGSSSVAGNGGTIGVTAGGSVAIGFSEGYAIQADGAASDSTVATGGRGGAVTVSAGGDVTLGGQPPRLDAPAALLFFGSNGVSARGGNGSTGGRGGTIDISAGGQLFTGSLIATGGAGRDGGIRSDDDLQDPPAADDGALPLTPAGNGGAGGSISVLQGTGDLLVDFFTTFDARGGAGGAAGTIGNAGAGGDGGTLTLRVPRGALTINGEIGAGGGIGGLDLTGSSEAASGSLGTLQLFAGGDLSIAGSWIDAARTNITARAGGNVLLQDALFTEGGAVVLSAGDPAGSADGLPAPGAVNPAATLTVGANIDTRRETGGASGAITLHANGNVVIDAAQPVYSLATETALRPSPTGTIAGGLIDIAGPLVSIASSTAVVGDQQVRVAADTLALDGTIAADLASVVLTPFSNARAIRLGGDDDRQSLFLSQQALDQIRTGSLIIGDDTFTADNTFTGGITIAGPISLDEARIPVLGLIDAGAIRQSTGSLLTVGSLEVAGSSVLLDQVAIAHTLSGIGGAGGFEVHNLSDATLEVGRAGFFSGISTVDGGAVQVTTPGRLRLHDDIFSGAAGDAVVLSASGLDVDQTGGIFTFPGRWLVYLPGRDGNQFGSLFSGNQAVWNRSFGATVGETGNRYVFAQQPVVDIVAPTGSKVYDGSASVSSPALALTGLVDASLYGGVFLQDTATGSLAVASRNVGSYSITQGSLDVPGYQVRSFEGGVFTITPRLLNVTATGKDKVYDGTTAASVSLSDDRVAGDLLTLSSTAQFSDKNARTGKLVLANVGLQGGADAGNYVLSSPLVVTSANITPRTLNVAATAQDKVYDGSTTASAALSDDRILGDSLIFLTTAAFADKNAGSGKTVNVTLNAVAGVDASNYTLSSTAAVAHANITPRTLNVALAGQDKVYDGSTAATVSVADDRILGDVLALGTAASFSDKNAGTGKLVTAAVTSLTGADAGNYKLASTEAVTGANITPRTLNLSVTAQDKVYDGGSNATLAIGGDDRIAGDQLTPQLIGVFNDRNVGTGKQVLVGGGLLGADADNYRLAVSGLAPTASITPRTLHVAATAQDKVYDGSVAASISLGDDRLEGDALSLAGSGAFVDANAGAGKAVTVQVAGLTGSDAGNYVLAQPAVSARASITPAPLTITARDASKVQGDVLRFDGTEFTASGLVAGESVPSVTLASAGVGQDAVASQYAITPSAAVAGGGFLPANYAIRYSDGLLTVLPPPPPATGQVNNQVVTFAQLFVQEALRQQGDDKDKGIGRDDIVITDTACKP